MEKTKFNFYHRLTNQVIKWDRINHFISGADPILHISEPLPALKNLISDFRNISKICKYFKYTRPINLFDHHDFVPMQFTGMFDMANEEIYEYDTCKNMIGRNQFLYEYGEISFVCGSFILRFFDSDKSEFLSDYVSGKFCKDLKIVGCSLIKQQKGPRC